MGVFKVLWFLIFGIDLDAIKTRRKLERLVEERLGFLERRFATHMIRVTERLDHLKKLVEAIGEVRQPSSAVRLVINLDGVGENQMLQVATNGSVVANLVAQDAAGNPGAKLDSVPTWTVSDETLGSVNASEDGMTAVVVLTGKIGKFVLTAKAKVGDVELSDDSDEIEVVVGAAALLTVNLSAK